MKDSNDTTRFPQSCPSQQSTLPISQNATQLNSYDSDATLIDHDATPVYNNQCESTESDEASASITERCDNQLEESKDHELGSAPKVHHDRLIISTSPGQATGSDEHELGSAPKVHHDRLIISTPLLDNGIAPSRSESHEPGSTWKVLDDDAAPLYPKSDELRSASNVNHDRLTFWLTNEQVEEEKTRSRKPWRNMGYNLVFDTSGIDPKYGDHEYLIDVFLQSTFFRMRSNKKIVTDCLRKKWQSFAKNVKYRIDTLKEDRQKYEASSQGYNFRLHSMCLQERIPCAVARDQCELCGPQSRHFNRSMIFRPEYNQLSEELRELIAGSNNGIGMIIREAAAEFKAVTEMEEKPIVKYVFKHMSAISADLNEWISEIQDNVSTSVDLEMSLNMLQDDVTSIERQLEDEDRLNQERIENAVHSAVSEAIESIEETVEDAAEAAVGAVVEKAVEATTNAKFKRLSQNVVSMSKDISTMMARQEEMKNRQEEIFEEMKTRHEEAISRHEAALNELKTMMLAYFESNPKSNP